MLHSRNIVALSVLWTAMANAATAEAPAPTPTAAPTPSPEDKRQELENVGFSKLILFSLLGFLLLPVVYGISSALHKKVRLLVSLNDPTQHYFATPAGKKIPWIKKNIIYAPLFKVRHNREFQLTSTISMGTLPTRFQTFFLVGYLAANVVFATYMIDYTADKIAMWTQIRNRCGSLAVVNMVPLFLLAGRNNPLVDLLEISHDTCNTIHRWFGRMVAAEVIMHVSAYVTKKVLATGWSSLMVAISTKPFLKYGMLAFSCFVAILFTSPSPLRRSFYETFLTAHILLAVGVCVGVYYHIKLEPESSKWMFYMLNVLLIWGFDRFVRIVNVVYRNMGRKSTTATVEALPGEACRVTVRMARPFKPQPGQHLYLYIPSIGWHTSHPFTIAWVEDGSGKPGANDVEKQDLAVKKDDSTISMIIRRRTGFTDKLWKKAYTAPERVFTAKAAVEGPYGVVKTLDSYGTVVLIAGGVGITHPVPYIRRLVAGYAAGTVATRRLTLVWVLQSPDHLEWIRPWMTEILGMEKRREVLKVLLFVTRPKSAREIHSPSATVQMFPGRPNFDTLLKMEVEHKCGAMAVTVCGGGSLSDDVRRAVRDKSFEANIDFVEEAFSW